MSSKKDKLSPKPTTLAIFVRVVDGATQFTLIPRGANSRDNAAVSVINADFIAP
jgi:hypothetical protein